MKKREKNSKRKLLVVLGISAVTVLGSTLAYFTTSTDVKNVFKAALYQNQIIEKFESPTDWTPGTTTCKEIKVTNNGSIKMAVRAKYSEKWVSGNGTELSLKDSSGNTAAIINFNTGWTKDCDGYYYYGSKTNKTVLNPNESTNSFISGVTFNENIAATLTSSVSSDGKTITYTSSGNGYDNATYTLTVTIDTIQYDQASNVWK